ncbi:DUF2721 domain-containing protein [Cerasicoccus maritimus]|uniref:DUF2721 domain-containing protein n=1 Tax=Cerasicoccus maritimus TaxID=490089 RepID=UPI0028528F95|nr:DUF2721 domain-containing protein [Cerasicoccus maritimus]
MIDVKTPAILFPAVSLLMLAYTNRFLALARIVRDLAGQLMEHDDESMQRQIDNLEIRLVLIKWMQALGILSLLSCLASILAIHTNLQMLGEVLFGLSVVLLFASLTVCLREVMLAGNALKVVLENCRPEGRAKKRG